MTYVCDPETSFPEVMNYCPHTPAESEVHFPLASGCGSAKISRTPAHDSNLPNLAGVCVPAGYNPD